MEIALQRARLEALRFRASTTVSVDYSLRPLDRVRVSEVDQDLLVIGVTHQWLAGDNPEVTELLLQGTA